MTFEGSDVPVGHDVPLEVSSVHGDVITVPTLTRLLGGAVL